MFSRCSLPRQLRTLDFFTYFRTLSPQAALVLADGESLYFEGGGFAQLPSLMAVLPRLPEAFATGIGLPFDAFGPQMAIGGERELAPRARNILVPDVLPRLQGVVPKLEAGAKVADIGCGTSVALIEMAKAFERSKFHGYEISKHALARARKNLSKGRKNLKQGKKRLKVTFHEQSGEYTTSEREF